MPSELFMRLIFCRDTAQALMLSTQGMLFDLSSTWMLCSPALFSGVTSTENFCDLIRAQLRAITHIYYSI